MEPRPLRVRQASLEFSTAPDRDGSEDGEQFWHDEGGGDSFKISPCSTTGTCEGVGISYVKERAAHLKELTAPSKLVARVPRVSPRPNQKGL